MDYNPHTLDLSAYTRVGRRIQEARESIQGTLEPYITSLDEFKRTTQAKTDVAAKMIAFGSHRLATQAEIAEFLRDRETRTQIILEESKKQKLQVVANAATISAVSAADLAKALDKNKDSVLGTLGGIGGFTGKFVGSENVTVKGGIITTDKPAVDTTDYKKKYDALVADINAFTPTLESIKPGMNPLLKDVMHRLITLHFTEEYASPRRRKATDDESTY